jgi:hypothetical protein
MIRQILSNNNENCYRNFSPKIFASKHALNGGVRRTGVVKGDVTKVVFSTVGLYGLIGVVVSVHQS